MGFLSPILFIFLLSFIPVIILYLLKKEHKEIEISSTFLWEKVIKDLEVNKPFSRLNKHILLLLQLLVLLFLVIFLTKPYFMTDEPLYNEVLIVVDNSLSMSKQSENKSLLDLAKEDIVKQIKKSNNQTKYTVITYNSKISNLIQLSSNKSEVINIIKDINQSLSHDNQNRVESIIDGFLQVDSEVQVLLYTDKELEIDSSDIMLNHYSSTEKNIAISSLVYVNVENGIDILVTIENYDNELVNTDLLIYSDNKMIDVVKLSLKNGITNELIKLNSSDIKTITAKLDIDDSIEFDNIRYLSIQKQKLNKVLLISSGNLYLEKALSILDNVELYKTEELTIESGYDMYVFDGELPEILPSDGNILFVNPSKSTKYFDLGELNSYGNIKINNTELMNSINENFIVENGIEIKSEYLNTDVLFNDKPIIKSGKIEKVKVVVIGFSIFDSDIALKIGFPVLISNIYDFLLSNHSYFNSNILVNETVDVSLLPTTISADISNPKLEITTIAPPFPSDKYDNTSEVGFYVLEQKYENGFEKTVFAINVNTQKESNSIKMDNSINNVNVVKESSEYVKKSFKIIILLLALLILMIEWGVFRNDS